MKTEIRTDSLLFKVHFIHNRVFITDEGVTSLYFTLKSQEVWKVASQQQIFALINIPWAITCKKGLVRSRELLQIERERVGEKAIHPAVQIRVWRVEISMWILSEGQCRNIVSCGTKTESLQWGNARTESKHFTNPSSCIFIYRYLPACVYAFLK